MEEKEVDIKDIVIINRSDNNHILIFITEDIYMADLLKTLGNYISITLAEDDIGVILLDVFTENETNNFHYNTQKTVNQYQPFIFLKNREVSFWSVGHRKSDGRVFFHTPPKYLI